MSPKLGYIAGMGWEWVVVVAIVLMGPVRIALRLRAKMRATATARRLGPVQCAHCGSPGPAYGYATFFAREEVRCARCKQQIEDAPA